MERLTPAERADRLPDEALPGYPAVWSRQGLAAGCSGTWGTTIGAAGTTGSYPPGYLKRIAALFPGPGLVLHLFSGLLSRPTRSR